MAARGRPTQNSITVKLDDDLWGKLAEYRDNHFYDSNGRAARQILADALDDPQSIGSAPPDELARQRAIKSDIAEIELARKRRELVPIAEAREMLAKDWANVRAIIQQLPNSIPGLTDDQRDYANKTIETMFNELHSLKLEVEDDSPGPS